MPIVKTMVEMGTLRFAHPCIYITSLTSLLQEAEGINLPRDLGTPFWEEGTGNFLRSFLMLYAAKFRPILPTISGSTARNLSTSASVE